MIAAARTDVRAELAAQAEADASDYAIANARAAAYRSRPFWPFGALTPQQQRDRAAQEAAMRAEALRRAPEGLL